jgi:hypothetical protein
MVERLVREVGDAPAVCLEEKDDEIESVVEFDEEGLADKVVAAGGGGGGGGVDQGFEAEVEDGIEFDKEVEVEAGAGAEDAENEDVEQEVVVVVVTVVEVVAREVGFGSGARNGVDAFEAVVEEVEA